MYLTLLLLLLPHLPHATHLHIVSHHGSLRHPAPCSTVCAGTTPRTATSWTAYTVPSIIPLFGDLGDIVTTTVDISQCQFVDTPVVMTTIDHSAEGTLLGFMASLVSGTSTITDVTSHSFTVYIHGYIDSLFPLTKEGAVLFWDVHWSAFGYTC